MLNLTDYYSAILALIWEENLMNHLYKAKTSKYVIATISAILIIVNLSGCHQAIKYDILRPLDSTTFKIPALDPKLEVDPALLHNSGLSQKFPLPPNKSGHAQGMGRSELGETV